MGAADIVRRQAEAQNKGDLDTVVGFYTTDAVWTSPQEHCQGRDAIRSPYDRLYAAFPDGQVELGRTVEQGDVCMYEVTFRGTNSGAVTLPDGTDVPATGKPFEIESVAVIRVEGDLIAEYRIYWDQLAAMAQLGMMPS